MFVAGHTPCSRIVPGYPYRLGEEEQRSSMALSQKRVPSIPAFPLGCKYAVTQKGRFPS